MKRNTYNYFLLNTFRNSMERFKFIHVWFKQSSRGYKYHFYPIILTYTNKAGAFIERKFRDILSVREYLNLRMGVEMPV